MNVIMEGGRSNDFSDGEMNPERKLSNIAEYYARTRYPIPEKHRIMLVAAGLLIDPGSLPSELQPVDLNLEP